MSDVEAQGFYVWNNFWKNCLTVTHAREKWLDQLDLKIDTDEKVH
jgi:hypothetical protein